METRRAQGCRAAAPTASQYFLFQLIRKTPVGSLFLRSVLHCYSSWKIQHFPYNCPCIISAQAFFDYFQKFDFIFLSGSLPDNSRGWRWAKQSRSWRTRPWVPRTSPRNSSASKRINWSSVSSKETSPPRATSLIWWENFANYQVCAKWWCWVQQLFFVARFDTSNPLLLKKMHKGKDVYICFQQ